VQVGPDNERFGPMVILGGDGRIFLSAKSGEDYTGHQKSTFFTGYCIH